MLKAVENVNGEIARVVVGMDATAQKALDERMLALDGTKTKSRLGANAILSVSLAAARAASRARSQPLYRYLGGQQDAWTLPVPMMNIVNGGSHSDAPIAFQEFMIRPIGLPNFREALRAGAEVFQALKSILKKRGLSTAVGDEGGFAPVLKGTEDAIETILEAIEKAGYKAGRKGGCQISLALDCAASEFFADGAYDYGKFETPARGQRRGPQASTRSRSPIRRTRRPVSDDSIEDGCPRTTGGMGGLPACWRRVPARGRRSIRDQRGLPSAAASPRGRQRHSRQGQQIGT